MDEAKTLVHMSIQAIFASLILAAAAGLIGVGYLMWSYFSRQDLANSKMSQYSNYTSFDNTTVRGQEVLQLICSDLDIFVAVFDGTTGTSDKTMDGLTCGDLIGMYTSNLSTVRDFNFRNIDQELINGNSSASCRSALNKLRGLNRTPMSYIKSSGDSNVVKLCAAKENASTHEWYVSKWDEAKLLQLFTKSSKTSTSRSGIGAKLADITKDSNSYAPYKAALVYDGDATSDIVGVVLIRGDANTVMEN